MGLWVGLAGELVDLDHAFNPDGDALGRFEGPLVDSKRDRSDFVEALVGLDE